MEEKKLVSFLQQTKKILSDFFPLNSVALFPLMYSSLVWALNRKAEIKTKVLELEVWLDPDILKNKADEFVLNFFESRPGLREAYAEELSKKDLKGLKAAFKFLYPVVGLEDPFLENLFSLELREGNYRRLGDDFESRLSRALSEIQAARARPEFWKRLKTICGEFLNLCWSLMTEAEVRKQLRELFSSLE